MKRLLAGSIVAAALAALASQALAQPNTPRVDQRQENQARRIEQGKQSGALTKREARRLEAGQARVAGMEKRAKADGTVSKRERARLERANDRQSRRIAKQKHDRQARP